MDREYIKEKINHNRNIKDNLWTAFIVTAGGTLSLMLNPGSVFKITLIISGFIISIGLISSVVNRFAIIENLLKN